MCSHILNTSKDGDFTTSLRNAIHCSITSTLKMSLFRTFLWNSLLFSYCPLTLGPSLGTTDKTLAQSSLHPPPSGIYPQCGGPPEFSLLQEQSWLSQPLLEHMADVPSPLIISVGCVITTGAVWSRGTVNPDRGIWRSIPAHPCQIRSLESVPSWWWMSSPAVCPLALDAAEGTETLENLYVWSSKSPYRYILVCSLILVSGTESLL